MERFKIICVALAVIVQSAMGQTTTEEPTTVTPDDQCVVESYTFSVYDYIAVCGMLVVSLGIGVFYGFFQKKDSAESFLMGSDMNLGAVALSLMTSFITAIELLGNPAEVYFNGLQYSLIVISLVLVIPTAAYIFYPIYFRMELSSCYEYLGVRFDKRLRIFGAVLYIVQMSFYTAVAVLAPAIALSKATGLDTTLAVVFIYVVCVFYASQGGMKAVVIADTFQAIVLGLSLLLVIGLGSYFSFDISQVFNVASHTERLDIWEFSPDPTVRHSIFSVIIGGFFYWASLFCTNQAAVQKGLSLRKQSRANHALILAVIGVILIFIVNFYTGLLMYLEYSSCDPLTSGKISASDQLLPFYVMDVFQKVTSMTGIFVAGIFAASLGTVAAALNSLATVALEDVIVAGFNVKIQPEKGATYAKWMSLGFGVFSFALVFIVQNMGGILQVTLTLNGLIGGVTLGLFSAGIFFKSTNSLGTFCGGVIALVTVVFIGIMAQFENLTPEPLPLSIDQCDCIFNNTLPTEVPILENTKEENIFSLFRVSYLWYPLMGTAFTVLLSVAISKLDQLIKYRNVVLINNSVANKSVQCFENRAFTKE